MQAQLSFWALMAMSLQSVMAAPAVSTASRANAASLKKAAALTIEDNFIFKNCGQVEDPISRTTVSGEGLLLEVFDDVAKLVALATDSTKAVKGKKSPFERLYKPTSKASFTEGLNSLKKPPTKGGVVIFCHPDEYIATPLTKAQSTFALEADDGTWWDDGRTRTAAPGDYRTNEHPKCNAGSAYYLEPFTNRIHLCKQFWKAAASVATVCPGSEATSNDLRCKCGLLICEKWTLIPREAFHLISAIFETPLMSGSSNAKAGVTALKSIETQKPANNGPSYAWAGICEYCYFSKR